MSPDIANALKLFSFDILHAKDVPQFQNRPEGVLDPEIIAWCKENRRVWITHDFETKRKHQETMKTARINVVWVRGHARPTEETGESATWRFFKTIVRTIDETQRMIATSHGAIHFKISQRVRSRPDVDWAESSYDKPKGNRFNLSLTTDG